jgi:hypothetical protein
LPFFLDEILVRHDVFTAPFQGLVHPHRWSVSLLYACRYTV